MAHIFYNAPLISAWDPLEGSLIKYFILSMAHLLYAPDCWLMAPEKSWCLVELPARWEPQEEGVMNIAARFSLS
jgi:hypothetical protein